MDWDEPELPPEKMKKPKSRPVMLKKLLERLLNTTAILCQKQHRNRAALDSFIKLSSTVVELLDDPEIIVWKRHMHNDVNAKCGRIVELCVFKIDEDSIDVLNTLAAVLNPNNRFHQHNATRMSKSVPPGSDIPDENLFARPLADPQNPRGWLVDLINRFGDYGGFIILLSRFQQARTSLSIPQIHWLLRPIGQCHELYTVDTIVKYLLPIVERIHVILDTLTDEELKDAADCYRSINHDLPGIIVIIKNLISRVPEQKELTRSIESLKLRLIFRILHTIRSCHEQWVTLDSNLDPEQWDNVLKYFQASWEIANENTRVKMLTLLQQWVIDNRAALSHRVLVVLWDLAHSDDISTKILDQALGNHIYILSYVIPQDCEEQIFIWLDKCIEELLKSSKWALPAVNYIKEFPTICQFNSHNLPYAGGNITQCLKNHSFLTLIIDNLSDYMEKMHQLVKDNPGADETSLKPDGWYNHKIQVQRRLDVVKHLLKYGSLRFNINQINTIWQHLVQQPVFNSDREIFVNWFSMEDLDPTIIKDFFKQNILQLDPSLLTVNGMASFDGFFKHVNDGETTLDNFIGIDYLWRVVITSPEVVASHGCTLLKRAYAIGEAQSRQSKSECHRTFIAECRNRLQVHSDALSRLTGVETIEVDDQRKKNIVKETRKMDRVMKFLWEYTKECGWDRS